MDVHSEKSMFDHTQNVKNVSLYSQETLERWILSLPTVVRNELVQANCDTSAGYVLKRLYTRDYDLAPTFKLKIALGLDKASQGKVDFRDFVEGRDDIDWAYLHKVLGKRLRAEAAAAQKASSLVSG